MTTFSMAKFLSERASWPKEWQDAFANFKDDPSKKGMAGGGWLMPDDQAMLNVWKKQWESGYIPQPQRPQYPQGPNPMIPNRFPQNIQGSRYVEAVKPSGMQTPVSQTPVANQQLKQTVSGIQPLSSNVGSMETSNNLQAATTPVGTANPSVQYSLGSGQSEQMSPQTFSPKGKVSSQVSMTGADMQRLQAAGAPVGGNINSNPYASWAIQDGNMVKTVQAPSSGITSIPGLTDKPVVTQYPINQPVSGNQQIMAGIQGTQQAPGVQDVLKGIDPKYAPYVQQAIAKANEVHAGAEQAQQNVQDARNIMVEGMGEFQQNLSRTSQLAAENQVKAGQRAQEVLELALANHAEVLARGEKAVDTVQQGINDARSRLGGKMDEAKATAAAAWDKAERGVAADIAAARTNQERYLAETNEQYSKFSEENWKRFDTYNKEAEVQLDKGIEELKALYGEQWGEAEQRLEDSINLARENVHNLTADRVQANAAGINAAYDDAIRKARAEANMSGDPAALAKVDKLEQQRKKGIAVEVSKARTKYEDAVSGVDVMAVNAWQNFGVNKAMAGTQTATEIMKTTNAYGLQRLTLAGNMCMQESQIMASLASQGLGLRSNLESQGMAISADMKKQRANVATQLGLTDAELSQQLELAGLQLTANVITQEDMYAGYSGKDVVNAGLTMSQLAQQADYNRVATETTLAQLSRQGYADFAKFIQETPVIVDSSLSMLLLDLADLNMATTFEQEQDEDEAARARFRAYSGANWGSYAPTQDSLGSSLTEGYNPMSPGTVSGQDVAAHQAALKANASAKQAAQTANKNPMSSQENMVNRAYA